MSQTIVALFRTMSEAQAAQGELVAQGYSSHDVRVLDNSHGTGGTATSGTASSDASNRGTGIMDSIKTFFSSMTSANDDDHQYYANGLNRGGALVSVTVADSQVDSAIDLLDQCGADEIEDGAGSTYGLGGANSAREEVTYVPAASTVGAGVLGDDISPMPMDAVNTNAFVDPISSITPSDPAITGARSEAAYSGSAPRSTASMAMPEDIATANASSQLTGDIEIPVVQEELQVGKRQVNRGGIRVYSHVVTSPVEENINLREERVHMERTPVDRAATVADLDAFKEGSMEFVEIAEEPVVSKQARVVEEVTVGKNLTEHTETIRDNVRRTEVDVEDVTPEKARSTTAGRP